MINLISINSSYFSPVDESSQKPAQLSKELIIETFTNLGKAHSVYEKEDPYFFSLIPSGQLDYLITTIVDLILLDDLSISDEGISIAQALVQELSNYLFEDNVVLISSFLQELKTNSSLRAKLKTPCIVHPEMTRCIHIDVHNPCDSSKLGQYYQRAILKSLLWPIYQRITEDNCYAVAAWRYLLRNSPEAAVQYTYESLESAKFQHLGWESIPFLELINNSVSGEMLETTSVIQLFAKLHKVNIYPSVGKAPIHQHLQIFFGPDLSEKALMFLSSRMCPAVLRLQIVRLTFNGFSMPTEIEQSPESIFIRTIEKILLQKVTLTPLHPSIQGLREELRKRFYFSNYTSSYFVQKDCRHAQEAGAELVIPNTISVDQILPGAMLIFCSPNRTLKSVRTITSLKTIFKQLMEEWIKSDTSSAARNCIYKIITAPDFVNKVLMQLRRRLKTSSLSFSERDLLVFQADDGNAIQALDLRAQDIHEVCKKISNPNDLLDFVRSISKSRGSVLLVINMGPFSNGHYFVLERRDPELSKPTDNISDFCNQFFLKRDRICKDVPMPPALLKKLLEQADIDISSYPEYKGLSFRKVAEKVKKESKYNYISDIINYYFLFIDQESLPFAKLKDALSLAQHEFESLQHQWNYTGWEYVGQVAKRITDILQGKREISLERVESALRIHAGLPGALYFGNGLYPMSSYNYQLRIKPKEFQDDPQNIAQYPAPETCRLTWDFANECIALCIHTPRSAHTFSSQLSIYYGIHRQTEIQKIDQHPVPSISAEGTK